MNSLLDQVTEYNNLYWAWEKAKWLYKPGDIWFSEIEVAAFEANLSTELLSIKNDLIQGDYRLNPIKPVAYPKGKNSDGPRTRQTFWVNVRDQVTWIAIVNVIGKYLDSQMPFWSYGNRLYISAFKEDGEHDWKFGNYRNTTKHIYRKWTQSWPLYRRHINITAKFLTKHSNQIDVGDLDEIEENLLNTNDNLNNNHPLKVKYLEKEYWDAENKKDLFWAGVDLEKFYPRVNLDVIQKNIAKYLLTSLFSKQFADQLKHLFDFKIDYSDWNEDDLKLIELTDYPSIEYRHIPTGLFVGGFLANLALLEVDKIINEKLEQNKNIAHFRYVDDHVILATSFEELTTWLNEYIEILKKENIGTEFNFHKTEPKALAEYYSALEDKEIDSDTKSKKKEAAEKTCQLDPDFPSPLMTQTLAKVSKIASTEFQLLDPDEERNLIADVEHLLVTEFPDAELRRDTRVSFAARMLTTIVPQFTIDITNKYNLEKTLFKLTKEIQQLESDKNGKAAEVKSKFEQLQSEKEKISTQLTDEDKKLGNEEKKLISRTIKLLLKAVRENHEKVRLWTRLLEFCLKTGCSSEKKIIDEIETLISIQETNSLSATFIHSLVLQVLSNLLIISLGILDNQNITQKKKTRTKNFIKSVLTEELIGYFENRITISSKSYEKDSYDLFKFTCGTIIHVTTHELSVEEKEKYTNLISRYSLIDWSKNPSLFCKQTNHDFGDWAWWIITKMPEKEYNDEPYLWKEIIPHLDLKKASDQSVLQLYPQHIPIGLLKQLDKIADSNPLIKENEGFLFEIMQSLSKKKKQTNYAFLQTIISKTQPSSATLCDWIEWTKEREISLNKNLQNHQLTFDPRLGEWMALEIIKNVANAIISKTENREFTIFDIFDDFEYSSSIHPANFKISNSLLNNDEQELTWEKLKRLVRENEHLIEFRAKDSLIKDQRFAPTFGLHNQEQKIQAILNGLGAMLICLLSKSYHLPSRWNPIGHQLAWLNLFNRKLRDTPVSTYTRKIIEGCLSEKNKESMINRALQIDLGFAIADDTKNDPPEFTYISDFVKIVELSQKKLERQQLAVASHQPRQLIPINLIQLTRNNYQEPLEEGE